MARYMLVGLSSGEDYHYLFDLPLDPSKYVEWKDIAKSHLPHPIGIITSEEQLIQLFEDPENGKSVLLKFDSGKPPEIIAAYCGDYSDIGGS